MKLNLYPSRPTRRYSPAKLSSYYADQWKRHFAKYNPFLKVVIKNSYQLLLKTVIETWYQKTFQKLFWEKLWKNNYLVWIISLLVPNDLYKARSKGGNTTLLLTLIFIEIKNTRRTAIEILVPFQTKIEIIEVSFAKYGPASNKHFHWSNKLIYLSQSPYVEYSRSQVPW